MQKQWKLELSRMVVQSMSCPLLGGGSLVCYTLSQIQHVKDDLNNVLLYIILKLVYTHMHAKLGDVDMHAKKLCLKQYMYL